MTDLPDISDLTARARAWAEDDPDPATRAELEAIVAATEAGDGSATADLADRFSGLLEFGTAGLRGALGSGPNRMNRAVVIRAAAGLTAWLRRTTDAPTVVIGFDARHNSDVFARDTAAVVVAAGGRALLMPRPLPTPVLAFAVRQLGADAGVMVTASHNPPQDNGYKVYLGDGSQIVPPVDGEIRAEIDAVESVAAVPRADTGWLVLGDDVVEAYLEAAVSVVDHASRDIAVVHTALHGVGTEVLVEAFERAGFRTPKVVATQAEPDPDFPTVGFPNPEEPGAIDAALELAEQVQPDIVIANDPDADRCAVAVPDPAFADESNPSGWRMLRGDEVGALLGAHILRKGVEPGAVFANSIVSSRLLAAMARAAGVEHVETLTGFKWIGRLPGLRYGYEEALGYAVDPDHVKDKDGITAALLVAELAAALHAGTRTRTVLDVLDDLAREHGVHQSDAFSVRVQDLSLIDTVMTRLRTSPPETLGGVPVSESVDLADGWNDLPPTDGLRWMLEDDTRVIVRPSGTEPKLKVYLEAVVPVAEGDLPGARATAAERLLRVRAELEELTRV